MNIKEAKQLPIYLTLKEVAELLKVRPRTIYAWVSDKRIPFERKGGLLRFRLDAVVAWNEPRTGNMEPSFAILGEASRRRL
jgi:excisionase family DNA binding protein